jgi:hypothetical protein
VGLDEVYFARAMWDEDYGRSFELAHGIADQVTAPELAGYRAWWWFLASLAATLANNAAGARDALQRGAACGVNAGWLRRIALYRGAAAITAADSSSGSELNAEAIWELLDNWGWAGPEFASHVSKMLGLLADQAHAGYHEGLELLGKCVGASCLRTTEPGAPDVVWSFPGDTHFGFEAKTEKKVGTKLSKKELQEAKGHVDWIRSRMADGSNALGITPVLVAPDSAVHEIGEPFAGGLYYVAPAEILGFARQIAEHLGQLRLKYSGRDYSSAQKELSADIRAAKMDMGGVMNLLTKTPLGT